MMNVLTESLDGAGIPASPISIIKHEVLILRRSYFHPKLIPHVAMWYFSLPQYTITANHLALSLSKNKN